MQFSELSSKKKKLAIDEIETRLQPSQKFHLNQIVNRSFESFLKTQGEKAFSETRVREELRLATLLQLCTEAQELFYLGTTLTPSLRTYIEQAFSNDDNSEGFDKAEQNQISQSADQLYAQITGEPLDRSSSLWSVMRNRVALEHLSNRLNDHCQQSALISRSGEATPFKHASQSSASQVCEAITSKSHDPGALQPAETNQPLQSVAQVRQVEIQSEPMTHLAEEYPNIFCPPSISSAYGEKSDRAADAVQSDSHVKINPKEFHQQLTENALKRLQESYQFLQYQYNKYHNLRPENEDTWQRLRQIIIKDQQLIFLQLKWQQQCERCEQEELLSTNFTADASTKQSLAIKRKLQYSRVRLQEIKAVRNTLRTHYPVLMVLQTDTIDDNTINGEVFCRIRSGFKQLQNKISDLEHAIKKKRYPSRVTLTPVIEGVKQQMNIDEEASEQMSQVEIALSLLRKPQSLKTIFNLEGALTGVTVETSHFFTQGIALLREVSAALTGLEKTEYEFTQAVMIEKVVAIAVSPNFVEREAAEADFFAHLIRWLNLVLASLELQLEIEHAPLFFKTAQTAEAIAVLDEANILNQLDPHHIAQLEKLRLSKQTPYSMDLPSEEKTLEQFEMQVSLEYLEQFQALFKRATQGLLSAVRSN